MRVDITCRKCGGRKRLDLGDPASDQSPEEHLHLVQERLLHRPSFQCFGGHMELRPPLPDFWEIHWDTLGE